MGHQAKAAVQVVTGAQSACPIAAIADEIGRLSVDYAEAQTGAAATKDDVVRALWAARETQIGKRMGVLEEAALALRPGSARGALFLAALLKGSLDGDEIDEARSEILAAAAEAVACWIEAEAGISRRDLARGYYFAEPASAVTAPAQ